MDKPWKARVQKVYDSLSELQAYDEVYLIAKRCGFRSAKALWNANPIIQGSINPAVFGRVKEGV